MSAIKAAIDSADIRIKGLAEEIRIDKYSSRSKSLEHLEQRKQWLEWLGTLSQDDREMILINSIQMLIDIDYVRFRESDEDDSENCLYWESCGDDLRGE